MNNPFKRMQKLAGLITESQDDIIDAIDESPKTKFKKSELKAQIREMVLAEMNGEDLDETKKKKDDEIPEVPADETSSEEIPTDTQSEFEPNSTISTPQDVQKELTDALEAAKSIGDEKLVRQIGNALTYFTRTQVAGQEGVNEGEEVTEELSFDAIRMMDGLINIQKEKEFEDVTKYIIADYAKEGFEISEAVEYLKMKVDTVANITKKY